MKTFINLDANSIANTPKEFAGEMATLYWRYANGEISAAYVLKALEKAEALSMTMGRFTVARCRNNTQVVLIDTPLPRRSGVETGIQVYLKEEYKGGKGTPLLFVLKVHGEEGAPDLSNVLLNINEILSIEPTYGLMNSHHNSVGMDILGTLLQSVNPYPRSEVVYASQS